MTGAAFAPAKVNLFLHVGPVGPDGYHPLCSLMVFADVGDTVSIASGAAGALAVEGPFAGALAEQADNLVSRAARALLDRAGRAAPAPALTLTKRLPVAAGLGGGSSDAGAALRLLRSHLGLGLDDDALQAVAEGLGADGAACLWGRPVLAEGRGERLSPVPALPDLPTVLVNPNIASPTGAVYAAFDAAGAPGDARRPALPAAFENVEAVATFLAKTRNDLEAPACVLRPEIRTALAALSAEPEPLFARMSGSGATCFALCRSTADAKALAARLTAARPHWWVKACCLGGPWTRQAD